jgi:hypothetical protein
MKVEGIFCWTGVVDTGGKFVAGVIDTGGALSREFSKRYEMTMMLFLGAWGKMIHEKNLEAKIS